MTTTEDYRRVGQENRSRIEQQDGWHYINRDGSVQIHVQGGGQRGFAAFQAAFEVIRQEPNVEK